MLSDERLIDIMDIGNMNAVKRYWELKERRGYLSYKESLEYKVLQDKVDKGNI